MNLNKYYPFLLLWALSMFFWEIISGSSWIWFFEIWWLFITFPLYLFHCLFFIFIAFNLKKISFKNLYFFWIIFWLYESWITKVLWSWYPWQTWLWMWNFLWIWIAEWPMLLLFWHPIMSFILPILVYEILKWEYFSSHKNIIKYNSKKNVYILIFISLLSSFTSIRQSLFIINLSIIWNVLIILILLKLTKTKKIMSVIISKKQFIFTAIYLFILYILAFIYLAPERIPKWYISFISIISIYIYIYIYSIIFIYIKRW